MSTKKNSKRKTAYAHEPEFAIPDVHGDPRALRLMLKRVPKGSFVVFLGDIVNKGGDSLGALSLLKAQSSNYKWHYLWGNHDLLFLRAMRGSLSAQVKLFTQRDGTQIFDELRKLRMKSDVESAFAELRKLRDVSPTQLRKLYRNHKALIDEVNNTFRSDAVLNERLIWMESNFKLFCLSPARNLYIHAGIPVYQNGSPKLDIRKLRKLEQEVAMRLSEGALDAPIFEALDIPEQSPLRLRHWIKSIRDPVAFCRKLGVHSIISGHAEVRTSEIDQEPFPIIRHDFGAATSMGNTPSVLQWGTDGVFTSHVRLNSKWRLIRRGLR